MDREELRKWMDDQNSYNESFLGEEINQGKLDKLNKLKQMCAMVSKIEPRMEAPFVPFDKSCRVGRAQLRIPYVGMVRNKTVNKMIAYLIREADTFTFSAASGEKILFTFGILDMWDKFHHEGYERND